MKMTTTITMVGEVFCAERITFVRSQGRILDVIMCGFLIAFGNSSLTGYLDPSSDYRCTQVLGTYLLPSGSL